jgi:hypothetical protein
MLRLDSVSPELAEAFRHAPPALRKSAARVAAEIAVSEVDLKGEEITAALESLRLCKPVGSALRLQLERLAARLDEEYFLLAEQGDATKEPDALRLFSGARAASALAFAVSEDSGQFHEAVYEAITAVEDAADMVTAVKQTLRWACGHPARLRSARLVSRTRASPPRAVSRFHRAQNRLGRRG